MKIAPLSSLRPGEEAWIVELQGGRGLVQKLVELGLIPGQRVRALSATRGGPVLVEVRGMRVALGRGMAARVFVRRSG